MADRSDHTLSWLHRRRRRRRPSDGLLLLYPWVLVGAVEWRENRWRVGLVGCQLNETKTPKAVNWTSGEEGAGRSDSGVGAERKPEEAVQHGGVNLLRELNSQINILVS